MFLPPLSVSDKTNESVEMKKNLKGMLRHFIDNSGKYVYSLQLTASAVSKNINRKEKMSKPYNHKNALRSNPEDHSQKS
jgi:hypothetical protein